MGPLAVKTAEAPEQIVALEITMVGGDEMVTLTVCVTLIQPAVDPVMV